MATRTSFRPRPLDVHKQVRVAQKKIGELNERNEDEQND